MYFSGKQQYDWFLLLRPTHAVEELCDFVVELLPLEASLLGKVEGVGAHQWQTARRCFILRVGESLLCGA